MYQEYAIDPTTICGSFDRFKLIWNGLGYGEGRLLSRFPGKWERKLRRSEAFQNLPPVRQKSIIDRLAKEDAEKRRSIPSGRDFDSNAPSWLEAAETCQATKPFHAILAEENPRDHPAVACFDDIGEEGDCWSLPRPWQIKRWHTDMATVAAPLLRISREILFVEPYFSFESRFTKPLQSFLAELMAYSQVIKRVEIHLKYSDRELSKEDFRDQFVRLAEEHLPRCCPIGGDDLIRKIEFFIWESPSSNRMHPRYILTEVAGLGFENGLDETYEGDELTDVHIVAGTSLESRWNEFQDETCVRPLIHRFRLEA